VTVAFHERPFAQRFGAMGDRAEAAFVEMYPKAHRLGLNRPALNMKQMDAHLRYTPDFMLEDGAYEVMGFSSRGNNCIKLKLEKLTSLLAWDLVVGVNLWVQDSSTSTTWCAPIKQWAKACYARGEMRRFGDNAKPYWELPAEFFP